MTTLATLTTLTKLDTMSTIQHHNGVSEPRLECDCVACGRDGEYADLRAEYNHEFPRVTHLGGRRLSTHIRSFVTPACSNRQLDICYNENTVPEWAKDDPKDWWCHDMVVSTIRTFEDLHRNTMEDLLESSIGDPPIRAEFEAEEEDRNEWGLQRKSLEVDYPREVNKYHFRRVLREIEVRGPDIKKDRLGKWKSPIYSWLRTDVPMKGAHTATLTCGGGGGGGGW